MKIKEWFSKKTHNKVFEIEEFNNTYVYWSYDELKKYPSLMGYYGSDEVNKKIGKSIIKTFNNNKYLYN